MAAGAMLEVVAVGFVWPKRELAPAAWEAAPPNKLGPAGFETAGGAPAGVVEGIDMVGLAGVEDALPKRPLEGGASEEPPKSDEVGAADEAGGVAAALLKRPLVVCVGLPMFPNMLLPPVVPPAPPKRPAPVGVDDPDGIFADAPPKRPPGFAAVVDALEAPKRPPPG